MPHGQKLSIDPFAVETFEMGTNPMETGLKGSSGNGCTVLTTCSPGECCDTNGTNTIVATGE